MPRSNRFVAAGAVLAYPLLCHAAVAFDDARWAAVGIAVLGWAVLRLRHSPAVSAAVAVACFALGMLLASVLPAAIVYAPPVVLNLALCALFASTLRAGSEPLITRFARAERGDMPADLASYTRRLTQIWVLFFALMAAISVALALLASAAAWSLFTNVVNYVLVLLMFVLEYGYRRIRYRHHRHAGPVEFLRRLHTYRVFARNTDGS
jgi:uncharacterized membrane protein